MKKKSGLLAWLGRPSAPPIRVHVVVCGQIGDGWCDVSEQLKVPVGTTLGELIDSSDKRGIPLGHALAQSPPLEHALLLNGEPCPVAENRDRPLGDGDQIHLLAPETDH